MAREISRRTILKGASAATAIKASSLAPARATILQDLPASDGTGISIERRKQIVLIGINRPASENRIDPRAYRALASAYYQYENDPSLRAAILFGHGENLSRGVDVEAFRRDAALGLPLLAGADMMDPLAAKLSKPLIVVSHGDTWNIAHDLHLSADIRIAATNVRFGRDDSANVFFPPNDSAMRFAAACGHANAMRHMLAADHWGAAEAYRIGEVQEIAPSPEAALQAGVKIAEAIARRTPAHVAAALASARMA